ncbi:MAG: hypothetical protein FK733_00055, partial [Asgard group archaeon]|nr:hypothetical protein [Asgard group archaeon]
MKKRMLSLILVVTILITQIPFMQINASVANSSNFTSQEVDTITKSDVGIIPPAPYGGVENIQSSHFRNPGFEEDNGYGKPSYYDSGSTTTKIIDSAYQTEVHSGTYGSYMKIQGNIVDSSFDSNRRSIPDDDRAYVDEILELDFWYNCKANPDIATSGLVNVRFQVMSDIGNIYVQYYLSSSSFPTGANSSAYGYFDIRGSIDSWTNINRNFTEDFISVFPARILSQCYIRQIYFECYSPPNPSGAVELLFDDVEINNGTGFNYFAENGDFEDGDSDYWRTYRTDEGYANLTENDFTQGQKSMNMTAYSTATGAESQAWLNRYHSQAWQTFPKGLFAQQSGEYIIEFDWKYTDTSSSLVEYAYLFLGCQNETFSLYINIFLGSSTDSLPGFTNYTGASYANLYIKADDFSVRNTWNEFSVDYYDLITSLGFSNLATNSFQITAYTNGLDARVQLLVDELHLLVYPLSDPSFENNWEWQSNDPLLAW